MSTVTEGDLKDVKDIIDSCLVIDNHAHNLLRFDRQDRYSLISGVTEARDGALKDTPESLAHLRAVKQLRELYDCDASATWHDLVEKRATLDLTALTRKCLHGTHSILIDDGLDATDIEPYKWHDQFTIGKNRRIVRIETLAADIMKVMWEEGDAPLRSLSSAIDLTTVWPVFLQAFENAIADEIKSDQVAGFKSVICYRTGLDVATGDELALTVKGQEAFKKYLRACQRGHYRIEYKGLNDCLVISACKLISASSKQTGISKPIQFHTGLGDNDISLLKSNPAHLQPLIAAFPHTKIVLLHSSYPFTREAGYLATVYPNAYLDVGEIFPMVSIEGQISAIKQSMELTPFTKLLWSTDGHHFPETYWLANKQFRYVLYRVFRDLLLEDVISKPDAIRAVRNIMFENSNRIYHLGIESSEAQGALGSHSQALAIRSINAAGLRKPQQSNMAVYDSTQLSKYLSTPYGKATTYFLVEWTDWLGTLRSRSFPYASFRKLIHAGNRIGISRGNLHTLQDDTVTPAVNATGQIYVEPDLTTIRPIHWKDMQGAASVLAAFRTAAGSPLLECPRAILHSLSSHLSTSYNLSVLVGFELEVTFLHLPSKSNPVLTPIESTAAHAWGTLTAQQATTSWPIVTKIVDELSQVGIQIEHFHSESGQGQYEFALPPLPLVEAVDTLYQTRRAIQLKAQRHGLRATFHPMPFEGVGSGLHAHISLNQTSAHTAGAELARKKPEKAFWAGVLKELKAICAFTLPNEESYRRVVDDHWTGGTWLAWGTENRETPLRRIVNYLPGEMKDETEVEGVVAKDAPVAAVGGSEVTAVNTTGEGATTQDGMATAPKESVREGDERWEIRCMDGLGNAYFALAAIVGAGVEGLDNGLELLMRDCDMNPARMTDEQGAEYGITEKLPLSLTESLDALEASDVLKKVLSPEVVRDYIVVKKAEREKLVAMEEDERRRWLIERY